MSADALETYLSLVTQMSDLLKQRGHLTAEIRRLHAAVRPLHQALLRTMTIAELNAAYEARQQKMLRRETR